MATPREEDYGKDNLVIQEDILNEWNNGKSIHFQIQRVTEGIISDGIANLKEYTDLVNDSGSEQTVSWEYVNGLKEGCFCTNKGVQAWDDGGAKNKNKYSRLEEVKVGCPTIGPNQTEHGTCSPSNAHMRTAGEHDSNQAGRVGLLPGRRCPAGKESVVADDLTAMEALNVGRSGAAVPRRDRPHLDEYHDSIGRVEGDAVLGSDCDAGIHGPPRGLSRRLGIPSQGLKGDAPFGSGGTSRNAEKAGSMSEGADAMDEERSLALAIVDEGMIRLKRKRARSDAKEALSDRIWHTAVGEWTLRISN
ncbi:hypothetical protein HN51_059791 [Arachis hypogaea]